MAIHWHPRSDSLAEFASEVPRTSAPSGREDVFDALSLTTRPIESTTGALGLVVLIVPAAVVGWIATVILLAR